MSNSQEFLDVLARVSVTTPSLDQIVSESGRDPDWLANELEAALADGLVEAFDGAGPVVLFTLTPLGAYRAGVRPSSKPWDSSRRWVDRLSRRNLSPLEPKRFRPKFTETPATWKMGDIPWGLVDRRTPGPLESAMLAEENQKGAYNEHNPPVMRHLLGINEIWDNRFPTHQGGTCPVCGGRSLRVHMYCLKCHRSGADHLFPQVRARMRRQMPRHQHLKGGV